MQSIIELFVEDFTATIAAFIVLLVAIVYLFAGRKSIGVFSGIASTLLSFFSGPFVYLRNVVLAMGEQGFGQKKNSIVTERFLLNRLFFILRALLVVLSVAVLAAGVVSGWHQLIPSRELRETISTSEQELSKHKTEVREAESAVKQMEAVWSAKRDSLTKAYDARRANIAETMMARNYDLASRIDSGGETAQQTLSEIRNYHAQNEYLGAPSQYEPLVTEITGHIDRQSLSSELKALLLTYSDNWFAQMLSRFDTRTLSESQLRFALYPAYHNLQRRLEYLNERIPSEEKGLAQYRAELRYDFGAFGLQLVVTLLGIIIFVWLAGLVIESLSLTLDMATNLEKTRESLERRTT